MIEQHLHVTPSMGGSLFRGEVPVSELISGDALAVALGLSAGVAQFSNEPWLHFVDPVDGLTKYVAKKPYRNTLSWNQIDAVGAAYGEKTIDINGSTYRVRLLKGANSEEYDGDIGDDLPGTHGSEWNRLFYPLIPNPSRVSNQPISNEGIRYGGLAATYTEADLVMGDSVDSSYNWCQESSGTSRLFRGGRGVIYAYIRRPSDAYVAYGWRPVLELVE